MPTDFTQEDFSGGDLIKASHIKRTYQPINNLETGAAWFRVGSGTANAPLVDFSDPDENGLNAGALTDGQIVHFKASATNTGAVTLTLNGTSSSTVTLPIKKSGNTDLTAGDIQTGQIVAVIYNSNSGGRFEMAASSMPSVPVGISFGKCTREYLAATQYINGTNQYLTWYAKSTGGTHISTWTNGLTANANGVYLLQWSAAGGCDTSPTGQFSIYPTLDGGWHQYGAGWYFNDGQANDFSIASGTTVSLSAGTQVGLYVFTSGVRMTIQRSNMTLTYLGTLAT